VVTVTNGVPVPSGSSLHLVLWHFCDCPKERHRGLGTGTMWSSSRMAFLHLRATRLCL